MSKILGIATLLLVTGTSFAFGDDSHKMICPEIDPASATAWLTLFGGALSVICGRRNRKQP